MNRPGPPSPRCPSWSPLRSDTYSPFCLIGAFKQMRCHSRVHVYVQALVFDFGSEVYLWHGHDVSGSGRAVALQLTQQVWVGAYDYSNCRVNPLDPTQSNPSTQLWVHAAGTLTVVGGDAAEQSSWLSNISLLYGTTDNNNVDERFRKITVDI